MAQILYYGFLLVAHESVTRRRDERGASAVEYLMIAVAAVGIAAIASDSVRQFVTDLVGQLLGS